MVRPAGTLNVLPYQHDTLPFDPKRDLNPIASVSQVVLAISTPVSMNVETVDQLVGPRAARLVTITLPPASSILSGSLVYSYFADDFGLPACNFGSSVVGISFVFHDGVLGETLGNSFGVAFVSREIVSNWLWQINHLQDGDIHAVAPSVIANDSMKAPPAAAAHLTNPHRVTTISNPCGFTALPAQAQRRDRRGCPPRAHVAPRTRLDQGAWM